MINDFAILISMVFVLCFVMYKTKDLLHPAVVLSSVFTVDVLFFIIIRFLLKSNYHLRLNVLYFTLGLLVFYAGTWLITRGETYKIEPLKESDAKGITLIYKLFLALQIVVCILFIRDLIKEVKLYDGDSILKYLYATKNGEYTEKYIFEFFRTLGMALSQFALFEIMSNKISKRDLVYPISQILITLVYVIIANNRQILFMFIIPMIFIYLYNDYQSTKQLLKKIFISILVLFVLIAGQCIVKKQPVDLQFLRLYLNSGIVSFSEWMLNPTEHYGGGYTFRVIFTILSKLKIANIPSYWIDTRYLELPHVDWRVGNVYTFYHGFAQDFGIWYAMFIQFLVGILYGFLYKSAHKKKTSFYIMLLMVFYYPLIMQFFTEQYASHVSYWVQVVGWLYLASCTNIFYKRSIL